MRRGGGLKRLHQRLPFLFLSDSVTENQEGQNIPRAVDAKQATAHRARIMAASFSLAITSLRESRWEQF